MLKITLEEISVPMLTVWKWSEGDFKNGLKFSTDDAKIEFYILPDKYSLERGLRDRETFLNGRIVIEIENPEKNLLNGLVDSNSANSSRSAEKIHEIYKAVFQYVTFLCRWHGNLQYLFDGQGTSFHDLFYDDALSSSRVMWSLNNGRENLFKLKKGKSRKISPIFKSKNLLTKQRWDKIRGAALRGELISNELQELIKIKGKANWGEKRIPIVETAALMEVVLNNKVRLFLQDKGQSKTKIDSIEKEIGFSILINLFLPSLLAKSEFKKYRRHINDLDALRKIRNDIMHKNAKEANINQDIALRGINAAIKITSILDKK